MKVANIAVICLVLLAGQFFALAHSVEHNFHETEASCDVFANVERSGNALFCDTQVSFLSDFSQFFLDSGKEFLRSQVFLAHQARAPPIS